MLAALLAAGKRRETGLGATECPSTMFKRIAAIGLIWVCTAFAWAILGTSIFSRTSDAQAGLSGRVASTWGAPQEQAPPAITREWQEVKTIEDEYDGKKRTRQETYQHSEPVKIDGSRITAALHVDYPY